MPQTFDGDNALASTNSLRRSARIQSKLQFVTPIPRRWSIADADGNSDRPQNKIEKHKPKLQLKRVRLTAKNLAKLDSMTGKGKSARAAARAVSTEEDESPVTSTTSKALSSTVSGFALRTRENGILDDLLSRPPTNLQALRHSFSQTRASPLPTTSAFDAYVPRVRGATNEATMINVVHGRLFTEDDRAEYKTIFNQAFTGFPKDVGFNNGLSVPQPDFVEGFHREAFRPAPVEHVPGATLYRDDPYSVTLPHLAGEWKGPGKDLAMGRLQSAYAGAALVYARNQALAFAGMADPPGHAAVTTFATDGSQMHFYAHYALPVEGRCAGDDDDDDDTPKLEYHQYKYASANLLDTYEGFRDGRRGIRNQQDFARAQSFALRAQLQAHWASQRQGKKEKAEKNCGTADADTDATAGNALVHPTPVASPTGSTSLKHPVSSPEEPGAPKKPRTGSKK